MALNLKEKLAQAFKGQEATQLGRKRTWSSANSGSSGDSGWLTPCSSTWRYLPDSGRFGSGSHVARHDIATVATPVTAATATGPTTRLTTTRLGTGNMAATEASAVRGRLKNFGIIAFQKR
jgi:hypothetical protein